MNRILVYLLTILVFFEDLICVFLPTPVSIVFRNISDALVVLSVPLAFTYKLLEDRGELIETVRKNLLIYALLVVPLLCLGIQYIRTGCISFGNYWTLCRFILFYLLVQTCKADQVWYIFIRVFNVAFLVQVVIGFLQAFYPDYFLQFFMPSYTDVELEEGMFFTGGREGEMSGYFAQTIHYAYLMLMKLVFIKQKEARNVIDYVWLAVIPFLIFHTDVRLSLALSFIILLEIIYPAIPYRKIIMVAGMAAAIWLAVKIIYNIRSGEAVDDFVTNQMATRLGILVYSYWPLMLKPAAFIGISNCKVYLDNWAASQQSGAPQALLDLFMIIYEDVFYGAFILYFGYISLFFLLWFIWNRWRFFSAVSLKIDGYRIDGIIRDMIFLLLVLNIANQALKVKVFSFVFWLLLAIGSSLKLVKKEAAA